MSVSLDISLHLLDSSTTDGRTGRLRPEGSRPTTHPRPGGLVGTVSRWRIGQPVAPVTSLVCTLVRVGQRCGVDWQAFRAKPEQRQGLMVPGEDPERGPYHLRRAGMSRVRSGAGRPRTHLTITLRHN